MDSYGEKLKRQGNGEDCSPIYTLIESIKTL